MVAAAAAATGSGVMSLGGAVLGWTDRLSRRKVRGAVGLCPSYACTQPRADSWVAVCERAGVAASGATCTSISAIGQHRSAAHQRGISQLGGPLELSGVQNKKQYVLIRAFACTSTVRIGWPGSSVHPSSKLLLATCCRQQRGAGRACSAGLHFIQAFHAVITPRHQRLRCLAFKATPQVRRRRSGSGKALKA